MRSSLHRFDRVELSSSEGSRNMTRREFERMPLQERIRAVMAGQLRFFLDGREIPTREALLDGD